MHIEKNALGSKHLMKILKYMIPSLYVLGYSFGYFHN